MREFIGHHIKVAVEVLGVVEGTMVDDKQTMILVKGSNGKITRVIKAHICGFEPQDFEPHEYVPFHVLFCENKMMPCPGVQYVKEGEGFTRHDLEEFVGPCQCRTEDCKMGTKGELRSVSGKFLRGMIAGTMFGEYPKKEEKRGSTVEKGSDGKRRDDSAASSASSSGEIEGGGTVAGKKSDHRRTVRAPKTTSGTGKEM